jgi:hypothetical protein
VLIESADRAWEKASGNAYLEDRHLTEKRAIHILVDKWTGKLVRDYEKDVIYPAEGAIVSSPSLSRENNHGQALLFKALAGKASLSGIIQGEQSWPSAAIQSSRR